MKIKNLLKDSTSKTRSTLEKFLQNYLLVFLAVVSVGGLGYMLFKEIRYIIASAPCPSALTSPITGEVILNASDYSHPDYDYILDCSAVSIHIQNGGTLRIVPDITDNDSHTDDHGLTILANNFTIDAGGVLDLEGQGYAAGQQASHTGSGKSSNTIETCLGGTCGGSGAGHGGAGGRGDPNLEQQAGAAGEAYGSQYEPMTLGSGGGESAGGTPAQGGAGGGAVKLEVTNTFTLNGMINANGVNGSDNEISGGGGGAGGSIWIEAGTFAGNGSANANGGNGGDTTKHGGGGGGGRLVMKCTSGNTFTGSTTVIKGVGGIQDGQVGTKIGPSCYPDSPTDLSQYEVIPGDPETFIQKNDGESIKKNTIEFRFKVSDIDGSVENPATLYPQVEVREGGASGVAWTGITTNTGNAVEYSGGAAVDATVRVTGLVKTKEYKWRARVMDEHDVYSSWVDFGGDSEQTDIDFIRLGDPASLTKVSGDTPPQSNTVGLILANPFIITLKDSADHPIPDEEVSWEVVSGGGNLSSESTQTDASGQAQTTLTLGTVAGTNTVNALKVGTGGSPQTFTATGNAGLLDHYYVNVTSTVILINTNFTVEIEARDQYDNLISNANNSVTLADVLPTSDCTGADGPGVLDITNGTLSGGTLTITNQQYSSAEAIQIKVTGESKEGCSNTITVVTAFGNCFGMANDPVNEQNLTLTENQYISADPDAISPYVYINGGVIDCSNINVTVNSGVTVTFESYDDEDSQWNDDIGINLLAKSLNVQSTGIITSDGEGYGQGGYNTYTGPGGGTYNGMQGASYGGYGEYNDIGIIYGNVYEPFDLGSAGGGYSYFSTKYGGGPGGGAIKIDVSGTLTLNGTITSSGNLGAGGNTGGGTGGSIWIDTNTITGNGEIKSDGNAGLQNGKGAAAGRIAVYYTTNTDFSFTTNHIHAYGDVGAWGSTHDYGGAGTIYLEHKGVDTQYGGSLYIDNNLTTETSLSSAVIEGNYKFNEIKLTRVGHLAILGNNSELEVTDANSLVGDSTTPDLTVYGTFNYTGGGTLYINQVDLGIHGEISGVTDFTVGNTAAGGMTLYAHTWAHSGSYTFGNAIIDQYGTLTLENYDNEDTNATNDYGVNLNLTNLTVNTGGTVTATGKGYGQDGRESYHGIGGGNSVDSQGGSYGGYGENNETGSVYGNVYEPADLGSAGGGRYYAGHLGHGGAGGGALKLDISNTLTVNGEGKIESNGGKSWGSQNGGGGTGGSIWIETNTIAGSGYIKANGETLHIDGGNATNDGAGGRISIYYETNSVGSPFNLDVNHIQARGTNAGPGTIYIEQVPQGQSKAYNKDLYVDNNGIDSLQAGIVESTYSFNSVNLTRYGDLDVLGEGSILTVTSGTALTGDSTAPDLTVYGTFNYTGGGTLYINQVDLGIHGEISGVTDFTIGNTAAGGMTLYAHTWAHSGSYTFGNATVDKYGTLTLESYDNEDTNPMNDYGITLNLTNLTVEGECSNLSYTSKTTCEANGESWSEGIITASGKGYGQDGRDSYSGPGGGSSSGKQGGSYGGYGQSNEIGVVYGNVYEPADLGSSGGGHYYAGHTGHGGSGGGALKLDVANTATINGEILSSGTQSWGTTTSGTAGAGSGGSILIETNTIAGSGYIKANGETTHIEGDAADGSGGRIALYYQINDTGNPFNLDIDHIQARGTNAGPGTIYIEKEGYDPQYGANLYVDNNGVDGLQAGLVEGSYEFNKINLTNHGDLNVLGDSSTLTVTSGNALAGDTTLSDLNTYGTLIGPSIIEISGIDVGIRGEIQLGSESITLGSDTLAGGMTLYANTWAHNETNQYSFGSFVIKNSSILTFESYENGDTDYTNDYGVTLNTTNIDVQAGGTITADEKGYISGRGQGGSTSVSGGSYGGYGAIGHNDTESNQGIPYGSIYEPSDLGSAGNGTSPAGGAIKLIASDTLTINGNITANGEYSSSGGSIWISTNTLSGSNTAMISANGGPVSSWPLGGGGGGRIAIYYTTNDPLSEFPLDVDHIQSLGKTSGHSSVLHSGPGTIYIEHVGTDPIQGGSLYVDNNGVDGLQAGLAEDSYLLSKIELTKYGYLDVLGDNSTLTVTSGSAFVGDTTLSDLTVYGTLIGPGIIEISGIDIGIRGDIQLGSESITLGSDTLAGGMTLYAHTWAHNKTTQYSFGSLEIKNSSTLTLESYDNGDTDYTNDYGITLNASNIDVQAGGTITADGKGYTSRRGQGGSTSVSGGSYGGYGAIGHNDTESNQGIPYGSIYEPSDLGGAGNGTSPAGGAIKLIASDTLTINGNITANGEYSSSGGSIWISTNTLSGSNTAMISANGGPVSSWQLGGGGGGRIAIYYTTNDPLSEFPLDVDHIQSLGKTSGHSSVLHSGPGTIYIEHVGVHSAQSGDLYINNNSAIGGNGMDFEAQDYVFNNINIGENVNVDIISDILTLPEGIEYPELNNYVVIPDENKIGQWHMDNNWEDSSINDNDGSASGNASFTTSSRIGNYAGIFDGNNDSIDLGSDPALDLGSTFTIGAWIKPNILNAYAGIVSKDSNLYSPYSYMLICHNNGSLGSYDGSSWHYSDNAGIQAGNWYYVVWVLSEGNLYYYVNGDPYGNHSFSYNDDPNDNTYIGSWKSSDSYADFEGFIDEVTILNKALNQNEILDIYNGYLEYIEDFDPISKQRIGTGTTFNLTGDFTLSNGAHLNGSNMIFESDQGTGAGEQGSGSSGGGGGGHGGTGGEGQDDGINDVTPGGDSYDSSIQPANLGSGGGSSGTGASGGAGGGAISIKTEDGTVTIDGEINVNGSNGEVVGDGAGGGGAGGSIYINACDIIVSSTGIIKAEGGNGDEGSPTYEGGGGGGGIIVLAHTCTSTLTIDPAATISRAEGSGFHSGGEGIYGAYGIPQVYLQKQYTKSDVELVVGGKVGEKAIKFKFNVADPDATDTLTPQIEIEKAGNGKGFDGTNIIQGANVSWTGGDPVQLEVEVEANNNGQASLRGNIKGNDRIKVLGITSGDLTFGENYKWRGRVVDATGVASEWAEFGNNNDGVDFQITSEESEEEQQELCGNGIIDSSDGEQCDSSELGGLDCTYFDSFIGGDLVCNSECRYDTSSCYASTPVCGNGIVESGEQCDGDIGNMDCTDFDDFTGGTLSCSSTCRYDTSLCQGGTAGVCGDGVVNTGEQCDGDVGDANCTDFDDFTSGTLVCNSECEYDTSDCSQDPYCGNGTVEPGEQCDSDIGDMECEDFYGFRGGILSCNDQCGYDLSACTRETSISLGSLPLTGLARTIAIIILDSLSLLFAVISLLLAFPSLLVKREKKPWGLVYDEKNKQPVAFAIVRLYSKRNKLIAQKVTDLEGRYGFAIGEGSYKLEVNHDSYKQFKVKLEINNKSEGTVNRDIGLIAKRDIEFNLKRWFKGHLAKAKEVFPKVSMYMYVCGFVFSILATLIDPAIYNMLIMVLYVLIAIVYLIFGMKRGWGKVYNTKNKKGIDYAFVRVFDQKQNKLIDTQMTNKKGRYIFIVKLGKYSLLASKKGYSFPSKKESQKTKKTFYGSLVDVQVKKGKVLGVDLGMDPISKEKIDTLRLEGKKIQGEAKFGSPFR